MIWKWRLAGLGSGLGSLVLAAVLTFSPATGNSAAASVCFTTPAGCYCVDFFLTEAKEMVINRLQEAVQEKINEQEFFKNFGIGELVNGVGIGEWLEQNKHYQEANTLLTVPFSERQVARGDDPFADPSDPLGETLNGREARSVNEVAQHPERMAPYKVNRHERGPSHDSMSLSDWTDRVIVETDPIRIPSDAELADLPMRELYQLYDETRNAIATNYSRHYVQEMGRQEQRIQSLEAARRALDTRLPVAGAVDAARVHAEMLETAIGVEIAESKLRREAVLALIVSKEAEKQGRQL